MFKNLTVVFGLMVLFGMTAVAQERTWKTYSPASGAWSILAPGDLTPDKEAQQTGSKRGSYSFNDANGFFAIIYNDYNKLNFLPWKKSHFNKQRDLVMRANNATLVGDSEFTSGNITGREVRLRMPDNRTFTRETSLKPSPRIQRFRMFFQGNRFYMILAVVPLEQVSLPEIDKYFNSFTLK